MPLLCEKQLTFYDSVNLLFIYYSFYRYVLEPEVTFAVDSTLSAGPSARFNDMPQKPLLTLGQSLSKLCY